MPKLNLAVGCWLLASLKREEIGCFIAVIELTQLLIIFSIG